MEHKTYLQFLALVATDASGHFEHDNINIYFTWSACKARTSFSVLMGDSDEGAFSEGSALKKLKWSNDHPYFEIRGSDVFLTQDIDGIPTFLELRAAVQKFVEMSQEFNDQSMGSLSHCFK